MPSTSSQQRNHHVGGASLESPPPLCTTLVGKGASLVGGFSHSAVLFDEQPGMKHVRSKALRSLAAKAQAVVEGDVGYVVYKSVVLVRRGRPQHVDEQLHSRQVCLWGSIRSSSYLLFLRAICCLVLLASCPEYSLLWRWEQQQRGVLGMQRYV